MAEIDLSSLVSPYDSGSPGYGFFESDPNQKPFRVSTRNITDPSRSRRSTSIYNAMTRVQPNPDEVLRKLRRGVEAYDELFVDARVAGAASSLISGVIAHDYTITQGKADPVLTAFIYFVIERLPLKELLRSVLWSAFGYGYSVHEINWGLHTIGNAVAYLPNEIHARPVAHFGFTENGDLLFFSKQNPHGELLPPRKFLVTKHEADGTNHYGQGILKRCYWPVSLKKIIREFSLVNIERNGQPWPIVSYNPSIYNTQEKVDALIDNIMAMYQDGILIEPNGVKIQLVPAGASSSAPVFSLAIGDLNNEISVAWLGHTGSVQSTAGKLGNENSALVALDNRIMSGIDLCESFVNQLIECVVYLNIPNPDRVARPYFTMYRKADLEESTLELYKVLTESFGVRFRKSFIANKWELNEEDFDVVDPTPPAPIAASTAGVLGSGVPEEGPATENAATEPAGGENVDPDSVEKGATPNYQTAADAVFRQALDSASIDDVYAPMIDALFGVADNADSLESAYNAMDLSAIADLTGFDEFVARIGLTGAWIGDVSEQRPDESSDGEA